jgi:phosphatidylethanolamine/phosphatidyl-N-methylethanolamine N-methyltransferase
LKHSRNFLGFFREFLGCPSRTGAIAPSSRWLARKMVEWVDLEDAKAVAEYGPGTGVFTDLILPRLSQDCKFFAVELNPRLAEIFRQRYPDVSLHIDTVKNIRAICDGEGVERLDCVISGLPWACFSDETQTVFLDAMMTVLRPQGQFVTFAYLQGLLLPSGRRFRRKLGNYFSKVSRSDIVWANLPPAFVYQCRQ